MSLYYMILLQNIFNIQKEQSSYVEYSHIDALQTHEHSRLPNWADKSASSATSPF